MTLLKSKTLSISINSKPKTVYEFVLNLENLPKWAKMFCRSIKLLNGEWIAEILQEQAKVRITKRNAFGILDHYVKLLSSPNVDEVYVPMRVVQNDDRSEVIFTIFELAGMAEERYAEDIRMVEQDLKNLKSIVEESIANNNNNNNDNG
jgi:hypothetical protein